MAYCTAELRRVCVQTGSVRTDLALPAGVPVAALIPSVVAIATAGRAGPPGLVAPYRLARPGHPPLDGTRTLAQHQIDDGVTLLLTRDVAATPVPRFDDPAEQVAVAVCETARPWTAPGRRFGAASAAAALAGLAGFVAAPGGPGSPNALLATAAAAAVTLLTVPATGCAAPMRATVCGVVALAVLAVFTATAAAAAGVSLQAVGAAVVTGALAVIRLGGRIVVAVTGLARQPVRAQSAHRVLTALVGFGSAVFALGALGIAAGRQVSGVPGAAAAGFAGCAGAATLLQVRCHRDRRQAAALLAAGVTAVGAAVLIATRIAPAGRPLICGATIGLGAAAIALGFTGIGRSPTLRRAVEPLHWLTLAALPALACWVCGGYAAVRDLALG
ncbi:EsaB/YukD family protein [Mycobacterium sp. M1]|uniref:EsaB/YukD family protein n=1 Tax=Mycolicibacter acidiphilus TaxID=2835306 RepID=A0ABS5RNP3_9MYCO|nr:EsaB/YukD family protein [Mycolicibacter acidiphilus]MBS9535647.1 EsaB/YukD family protein [Mycolicibacter acidiphilus]